MIELWAAVQDRGICKDDHHKILHSTGRKLQTHTLETAPHSQGVPCVGNHSPALQPAWHFSDLSQGGEGGKKKGGFNDK